jgi:general secretion pathway protein H
MGRAPGSKSQAGYTLLEFLLALAILGAASALVVVNMPPPDPTLEREARTFAARLVAASDEAVVTGLSVGVDIDDAGYAFRRRVAGQWRGIADDPALAPRAWPEGATALVVREGERLRRFPRAGFLSDERIPAAPDLRFDPVGAATSFTLDLADAERGYRITVDPAGAVTLRASGEG